VGVAHVRAGAVRFAGVRAVLAAVALLAPALVPADASGHDQPFSHADVDWRRERLEVRLTVHRDDAISVLGGGSPEALMDRAVLAGRSPQLAQVLSGRFRLQADDEYLALRLESAEPLPRDHAVCLTFRTAPLRRPSARLAIECRLFPAVRDHETFLAVSEGARTASRDIFTATHTRAEVYSKGPAGTAAAFATYLRAGVRHIFIGPDHILFIVGLLLLGGGIGRVLKVATAFTLAHSITLAVAILGWFSPPSWAVEPLIALSIVYVGIENLRRRSGNGDWRIRAAFCFGLVHGFGFASVLREVGLPSQALAWSLLAFNLGVETGQAAIVLAITPMLAGIRAVWPRIAPRAIAACSWAIVAAGAYWFVERAIEPVRLLSSRL